MKQVEERYISLLTDFGFKRIFGTAMNKDLLICFLNSLFYGRQVVKDMIRKFGVTRYHANKVLNDLCEEPAARMYATKEDPVTIYRLRKKE